MNCIENKRNSNFELLRIIMMFLIIFNHLITHGFYKTENISEFDWYLINSFRWLGMIGNYTFMLLTGYFSISIENIKFSSIRKIHKKYLFYSVIIATVFFIFNLSTIPNNDYDLVAVYKENGFVNVARPLSIFEYIKSFFPAVFGINWYASSFLIFMFFIPFFNKCLKNCSKKEHLFFVVVLVFLGSFLQIIPKQQAFFPNAIFQFFMMYAIGAYIKLYGSYFYKFKNLNLLFAFLALLFIFVFQIVFFVVYKKNLIPYQILLKLSEKISTSFLTLIASVFLFLWFEQKKQFYSEKINRIGKSTFGIYLIHDNCYFSIFLMNKILKISIGGGVCIVDLFTKGVLVFLCCSVIDIFVSFVLEKKLFYKKGNNL